MKTTSVYDCSLIELPKVKAASGSITAVNNSAEIPFDIKRCYYLYDVPSGESRGGHAHRELQQLVIAASGSFEIILDDGKIKRTILLNQPNLGLCVPPGIWRDLDNFSSGAICLVMASEFYSEADYIRCYAAFKEYKATI